jgi:ATP synthase F1 complex assembly factor 2
VRSSKSVLIAHALVKGQINLEQASQAAQLELVYQTKNWGEVEDGHDTDMRETTIRMGDGLLFIKYGKAASEL